MPKRPIFAHLNFFGHVVEGWISIINSATGFSQRWMALSISLIPPSGEADGMIKQKIKIGLYGRGALSGMFVTDAIELMPEAMVYDFSKKVMSFRKSEIELSKTGYIDPRTAVRDLPLEKPDVRVHFEQTLFSEKDVKTTVSVIHMASLQMKILNFSTKEDNITKDNVVEVFRAQSLQIIREIRRLSKYRVNGKVNLASSFVGRPSTAMQTGVGRAIGSIRGPLGIYS